MSANKTEHLNLHSWVKTDPVRMEEFNENFNLLDAAHAAALAYTDAAEARLEAADAAGEAASALRNCRIETLSYKGNGSKTRKLTFSRPPKLVFIDMRVAVDVEALAYWGPSTTGYANKVNVTVTLSDNTVTIADGGSGNDYLQFNNSTITHHAIAFCTA